MTDWSNADWRRSPLCATGSCVEIAIAGPQVAMRDSKTSRESILQFDKRTWEEFLAGVRNGEFDDLP
jgi:hypothetical protein